MVVPIVAPMATPTAALHWDVFCRVIDNFGDIGVCWRLASQLATAGDRVRLFVDDASALAWMAPHGCPGVEVRPWPPDGGHAAGGSAGDVVVEAFGCELPPSFVDAMAVRVPAPAWINLEYLSAEPYVERSHGLPSPQPRGPDKFFYYPGFGTRTGGLLREPGLVEARARFDRSAWLARAGIAPRPGERLVSLFAYPNPRLPALLRTLAAEAPTLLLVPPGAVADELTGPAVPLPDGLRVQPLPFLDQPGFDRLLWACDLNVVRGEDSLVRAVWAGAPFVWMPYPQHDGAHRAKLDALIDRIGLPGDAAALWRAWSGFAPWPARWPAAAPWASAAAAFRARLLAQDDLVTQLRRFVARLRGSDRPPG